MNDYRISKRMHRFQHRIREEVREFLQNHAPEDSVLVLDSTGPAVTRHYLVLSALGRENVLRFKEIHAFSGGAFAIFGFLGLTAQRARLPFPELRSPATERALRRYHHLRPFSILRAWTNMARRRSAFGSNEPVSAMLAHLFEADYLSQPFHEFPDNIVLHLGQRGNPCVVRLTNGPSCDSLCQVARTRSLGEVVVAAITVPFVYGRANGKDEFFDAVYTTGYREALKATGNTGRPTLVSTPWRSGMKGNIQFINCFPDPHQKLTMLKDFVWLTLNLRNRAWGEDIYAAFES
jgi:hypothetical protein